MRPNHQMCNVIQFNSKRKGVLLNKQIANTKETKTVPVQENSFIWYKLAYIIKLKIGSMNLFYKSDMNNLS